MKHVYEFVWQEPVLSPSSVRLNMDRLNHEPLLSASTYRAVRFTRYDVEDAAVLDAVFKVEGRLTVAID